MKSNKLFANIFYVSRVIDSTICIEFELDSQDFKGVKMLNENILPKEEWPCSKG